MGLIQAYLGAIAGLVPYHHNKVSHNLFAGGGPCLQLVQHATSVKHNKAKYSKTRYAHKGGQRCSGLVSPGLFQLQTKVNSPEICSFLGSVMLSYYITD